MIIVAAGDSGGLWSHLMQTVFPRYVFNTLILMFGVGVTSLFFGLTSAWVISRYSFPGDRYIEWVLLLPATVPSYIIAYTYTDLLEYAGPIQGFLRKTFGWDSANDYWFPEIRSMGGAILVMSAVLFPYIYLMVRTAFRLTPVSLHEAASIHNRNSYFVVDLPLARPAIIAGLALVLMEVISDFGTVEYFAVETLTLGIFNVWLGMNNLTAAVQIAGVAFIFIVSLLYIEKTARSKQRFYDVTQRGGEVPKKSTSFFGALMCLFICFLPVFLGFLLPVTILLSFVLEGLAIADFELLLSSTINSVALAGAAAFLVMFFSITMVLVVTYKKHPFLKMLTEICSTGYAFPGVVLAIGVVSFSGVVDSTLQFIFDRYLGLNFSGFLIGGLLLLIFAYVVRFQAIGYGAINSGIKRLSPNLMNASFLLGRGFSGSMIFLAPRLLRKSLLAGGMLIFVDVMKELPMTLILRPFNYETLATYVYQFAKSELLEEAALAALIIILAGLGPVILMNASQKK
ncbi:MAG: hypothetical protein CFH42_01890 [Alphaproteobacteria bacterium MarineAlpha12_Bin1]|jgi:iron(III) transport system permease protein|nr:MAG: hypothetical protein CFH42_01890 [Alphaproteobacteria bacterium MarineAlpha12_Bin1]|tara:strand:- start:21400 stop:22938 length:1539 start_codon:yes stop_codon:yes gene_type:complete